MFQVEEQQMLIRFGSKREQVYIKNKNKLKTLQELLRRLTEEEWGWKEQIT